MRRIKQILQKYYIFIFIIVTLLIGTVRFNGIPVGISHDDARYIVLAESLSQGSGYHLINYPDAPSEEAFPPGWPLLLAPIVALFPFNFTIYKLFSMLFWIGTLLLARQLFAPRLQSPYLEAFLLLMSINPLLVGASTTILSEPSYLFFSLLTLIIFDKWGKPEQGWQTWGFLGLAILTAVFTLTIRSIGFTLMLSLIATLIWQNGRRTLILTVIGIAALATIPLILLNSNSGGTFIFSSLYSDHVSYIFTELDQVFKEWWQAPDFPIPAIASTLIPFIDTRTARELFTPTAQWGASIILLLIIFWQYTKQWARNGTAVEFYTLFYLLVFTGWAIYINEIQYRILIPIIPFLYYYLIQAIPDKPNLFYSIVSATIILLIAGNIHAWQQPIRERTVDLNNSGEWIRQHSEPDALIMSNSPVANYLYTHRQTVKYSTETVFEESVQQQGVNYILIHPPINQEEEINYLDQKSTERLLYLQANHERFQLVYSDKENLVTIYKVNNSVQ